MNNIKNCETCTFQILFTSDIHGAFMDYNYATDKETYTTGFSKLASLMRREKEQFDGMTFIVDVGDIIQGNGTNVLVENPDYKPYPLLAAFDAFGYDMVSIGNHEFNFGIPSLLSSFEGYKGGKLCGNVFDREGKLLEGFKSYIVQTLPNGLRIAFIGMVSPNIMRWDEKNLNKAGYTAKSAADETRKVIDQIKQENIADIIIMLGHMHTDNELGTPGSGANDVIDKNPEIDLFLGAHFHLAIGTKNEQKILNGVKFAENKNAAASYGKALLTASYEDGTWKIKNKTGTYDESDVKTDIIEIANDISVVKAVSSAHEFVKNYMRTRLVGYLKGGPLIPLPEIPGTHEGILSPTPLLYLILKIMKDYSGADIVAAAYNDYAAGCEEGKITQGKLVQMYVYDNNTIYRMKMTGAQVLKWMEWSHAYFGSTINGVADLKSPAVNLETDLTIPYGTRKIYLHDKFGGINYQVDLTKPVGSRINVTGMSDGKPFESDKVYSIAVNNYRATTNLLGNFDGGIFPEKDEKHAWDEEMDILSPKEHTNMLDWISEYIESKQDRTITNEFEPNWEFVNLNWNMTLREKAIDMIKSGKLEYDFKKPVKTWDVEGA